MHLTMRAIETRQLIPPIQDSGLRNVSHRVCLGAESRSEQLFLRVQPWRWECNSLGYPGVFERHDDERTTLQFVRLVDLF